MEEKVPSRLFRTLQILIPLAGVAVGITGVLLTVAARKKELTCTLVNSTRLVSENLGGIHPDLRVEFHGQAIFSLTKMTFDLRNTGAAAIMAKDVVEPVRLAFPPSTRLMSTSVERTSPSDLGFSVRAVPDSGDVLLDFPLLNRGDEAVLSVYIFNSEAQRPTLEGRLVDVPQLIYSEANVSAARQNMWPFQSHATRSVVRWVLISIYCALTLFFLLFCAAAIGMYATYLPWKRKWKRRYDEVVRGVDKAYRQEMAARAGVEPDREEAQAVVGEAIYRRSIAMRRQLLHQDDGLGKELEKQGIPPHPNPLFESIGGVAAFSAFTLSSALLCSATALIVYRALGG